MNSPSHAIQQQQQQHIRHRSLSQVAGVNAGVRLSSVSSQDSGFTSQDTLVLRPNSSPPSNQLLAQEVTNNIAIVQLFSCLYCLTFLCLLFGISGDNKGDDLFEHLQQRRVFEFQQQLEHALHALSTWHGLHLA